MSKKTIVAISCVTAIIITCILKDIDGYLVFTGVAVISGLGGFAIRHKFKK